ncbi:MAG: histidine kinase [Bacteroidetes bacterium]|nr:histidine kinase [Bacteroidota bacterium]
MKYSLKTIVPATLLVFFCYLKTEAGVSLNDSNQIRLFRIYIESDSGYKNINNLSSQCNYDSAYKLLIEFKETIGISQNNKGKSINSEKLASANLLYNLSLTRYLAWKYVNRNGSNNITDWKYEKLDSAVNLAQHACKDYLNQGYTALEPEYYITLGVIHESHNPQAAYSNYLNALKTALKIKNELFEARAHDYIGHLNYFGTSKHTAAYHLKKSFVLYKKYNDLQKIWLIGQRLGRLKNDLPPQDRLGYYLDCIEAGKKSSTIEKSYFVYENIAKLLVDEIIPADYNKAILYQDTAIAICIEMKEDKMVYPLLSQKAIFLDKANRRAEQYNILLEIYFHGKSMNDSGYISKSALLLAEHFKNAKLASSSNLDSAIKYFLISDKYCPYYSVMTNYDDGFLLSGLPLEYLDELMQIDSLAPLKYFQAKHKKYVYKQLGEQFYLKNNVSEMQKYYSQAISLSDSLYNVLHSIKVFNRDGLKVEKLSNEIEVQDNLIDFERDDKNKLILISIVLGTLVILIVISFLINVRSARRLRNALIAVNEAQALVIEKERQKHEEQIQRISLENEIQILRLQINPHFIFNSLNCIHNCILQKDTETAARSLTRFSRLVRNVLQNSRQSSISLHLELQTLLLYVELEKMRFNSEFQYEVYVDPAIDQNQLLLPPLIIQPFVENSLWHGIMTIEEKGKVSISINQIENILIIKIEDNGVGRVASKKHKRESTDSSLGVSLTEERIRIFNGPDFSLKPVEITDLYNEELTSAGTMVVLNISIQNRGNEDIA